MRLSLTSICRGSRYGVPKDGYAHVRFNALVYDGSLFEDEADEKESLSWTATLASHGRDPIATAEIKVGRRKVIEYFLYPLLRYMDRSIREPT